MLSGYDALDLCLIPELSSDKSFFKLQAFFFFSILFQAPLGTSQSPKYGSNWTFWKLLILDGNIWNNITMCESLVSKVGNRSWGRTEDSLFISYYTEVLRRMLFLSLDCSTLLLIYTL